MDDLEQMANDQKQLEWELDEAFKDLEAGVMLTDAQIDTLRYACGFPKKHRLDPFLQEYFVDMGKIFRSQK